jgi:hypothetical protein
LVVKKAKQSRYAPWRRLGERRYSSYSFSTSALGGGEWSASRPGRAFTPGERTPGTHWTGGWVGLRAGLDAEDRGKILCPCRGSNPDRPVDIIGGTVRNLFRNTKYLATAQIIAYGFLRCTSEPDCRRNVSSNLYTVWDMALEISRYLRKAY